MDYHRHLRRESSGRNRVQRHGAGLLRKVSKVPQRKLWEGGRIMKEVIFNAVRNPQNGSIVCSGMCDQGYLETKVYYGYTIKEARRLFREYLRAINA